MPRGDIVVATSRDVAAVENAFEHSAPLDVGDPDSIDAAVRGALKAHGRIDVLVNNAGQMSSVGGVVANPGHAAYATSKFALEGLSEALAAEVAPWGGHPSHGRRTRSIPHRVRGTVNALLHADQCPRRHSGRAFT
ncbi:SDR family NAD(P)-dependent oxidoreductase [Gordonia sp. (in: high G+C Gram-positive bacteria)]|uniref:SDR family NAD(P)-dependent oxidoreductase n=1 Tax=Gordonia sp. (in: high G+C Gram-positive bacteria) TaxID=84139 RepID=UPI003F9BFF60